MELTAKSLAQLLKSLRSNAATDDNRRREPRVGLRVRTDILHHSHGRMSVWVRDISAGGANLAVPMEILVGDELQLMLDAREDGEREHISCTVRHCRQLAPDVFALGVQFAKAIVE